MAIAEVLAGAFIFPPGERHYFTHISENKDEAAKTLRVLEQYLRILQVPFSRSGDTIELDEMPRGALPQKGALPRKSAGCLKSLGGTPDARR